MQYIDKISNLDANTECTVEYLEEAWNKDDSCFFPSFLSKKEPYARFCSKERRKCLETVLKAEQGNLCCYCMRNIADEAVTLEHVFPQSITEDTLENRALYAFYGSYAPAIRHGVKLGAVFERQYKMFPIGFRRIRRMPHQVAYANLTASCKGLLDLDKSKETACCCNQKRGAEKIIPLMFLQDTENHVVYTPDGLLQLVGFPQDLCRNTFENLGLNHDVLVTIRHIWCKIAEKHDSLPEIGYMSGKDRPRFLIQVLGSEYAADMMGERKFEKFVVNDRFWHLLSQYSWFFGYYKNHRRTA